MCSSPAPTSSSASPWGSLASTYTSYQQGEDAHCSINPLLLTQTAAPAWPVAVLPLLPGSDQPAPLSHPHPPQQTHLLPVSLSHPLLSHHQEHQHTTETGTSTNKGSGILPYRSHLYVQVYFQVLLLLQPLSSQLISSMNSNPWPDLIVPITKELLTLAQPILLLLSFFFISWKTNINKKIPQRYKYPYWFEN